MIFSYISAHEDLSCPILSDAQCIDSTIELEVVDNYLVYDTGEQCAFYKLPLIFFSTKNIKDVHIPLSYEELTLWQKIEKPVITVTSAIAIVAAASYSQPLAITLALTSVVSLTSFGIAKWYETPETDAIAKFVINDSQGTLKHIGMYLFSDKENPANIKQYIVPTLELVMPKYMANIVALATVSIIANFVANSQSDVENAIIFSEADSKKFKHELDPFLTYRAPITFYKRTVKELVSDFIEMFDIKDFHDFKISSTIGHFSANFPIAVYYNNFDFKTFSKTSTASLAKYFGEWLGWTITSSLYNSKISGVPKYTSLITGTLCYNLAKSLSPKFFARDDDM